MTEKIGAKISITGCNLHLKQIKVKRMIKKFYVYMISSECNKVHHIGMTNEIHRRVAGHKEHLNKDRRGPLHAALSYPT
jgi:hypothetical protein